MRWTFKAEFLALACRLQGLRVFRDGACFDGTLPQGRSGAKHPFISGALLPIKGPG